jgi:ATP-dependent DNA helicase RecG
MRGIDREDLWEYPEEALREAIVNALVHRDLSPLARGTQVQIQMYPDRLEIWNPGGLFGPVSTDRLGEPGNQASRSSDPPAQLR